MRATGYVQGIQTEQHRIVIHYFPEEVSFEDPQKFTDPFRYMPHPSVKAAADHVIRWIETDSELAKDFAEGKMLGVLVCRRHEALCYVAAFSGNIGGRGSIEGFVPPIYDLTEPDGYFKAEEARISDINRMIAELEDAEKFRNLKNSLKACEDAREEDLERIRLEMQQSKIGRDQKRLSTDNPAEIAELIRQSQYEKAELKRAKAAWAEKVGILRTELEDHLSEINALKKLRAEMSDKLQEWIFQQYRVHDASGQESSVAEIFASSGLIPPGGTGECAAPKLLEYAYRNGLKPLSMGEFWYGKSPNTAVRTHGHFYPSCTSKCGPLLGYMLKGLELNLHDGYCHTDPEIIHEDESLIIVCKPGGMPSVPGLDGRKSMQEWLQEKYISEIHAVHRLDMDTSGIMVFAKTVDAAIDIRKQFEEHSVRKTYIARLSSPDTCTDFHASDRGRHEFKAGDKGMIELPLSADYDERPRQKVDFIQGRPAVTQFEIISVNPDGTTDILFSPVTGRTHQLRVHAAHTLGLGRPIVGDRLYGGDASDRLHLHAHSIEFRHPVTGEFVRMQRALKNH